MSTSSKGLRQSDYPRLPLASSTTVEDKDGFNVAWKFCDARDKVLLKVAVADLPGSTEGCRGLPRYGYLRLLQLNIKVPAGTIT